MTPWLRFRKTEYLLALAGLGLVVFGAGRLLQGWLFEKQANLFASSAQGPHVESSPLLSSVARLVTPSAVQVLGRLSIPRLHASVLVVEGDDDLSLRLGVGHVPGTSMPGEVGNVALAAHRDTFFRQLRNIRAGDRVLLTTHDRTMAYHIERSRIVAPDDVSVLKAGGDSQLTLITCYPVQLSRRRAPKVRRHRIC